MQPMTAAQVGDLAGRLAEIRADQPEPAVRGLIPLHVQPCDKLERQLGSGSVGAVLSSLRFHGSRMWPTAVLAALAAGLLSGCGIIGPHSFVTKCLTGEVVGSTEPGGPIGNFFVFPGPFRSARSGPGDIAGSAFQFTITNDTGSDAQMNEVRVVTYSASGQAIARFSLSPGPLTNGDLLGRDMAPGQTYVSDPIADRAITAASGRFDETDTCKVFVSWSNPGGSDQF
jgi:hypothetical protein